MAFIGAIVAPNFVRFVAMAIVSAFMAWAFPKVNYIFWPEGDTFRIYIRGGLSIITGASKEVVDKALATVDGLDILALAKFIVDGFAKAIGLKAEDVKAINDWWAAATPQVEPKSWEALRQWVIQEKATNPEQYGTVDIPTPIGQPPPEKPPEEEEVPPWLKAALAGSAIAAALATLFPDEIKRLINQLPNPEEVFNEIVRRVEEFINTNIKRVEELPKLTPDSIRNIIEDVFRGRGISFDPSRITSELFTGLADK
ncbi:MAG: hypothetical protein C4292_04905, partial [Nitrososphaera sp.]